MPVDYKRYPPDWEETVERIRERSGNRCEGSPKYPNCRAENGKPHPATGSKVVLTTAHLDHDADNWEVADDRLRHWCQRCHLGYDINIHVNNRKYGRNWKRDQTKLDL